MKIGIATSLSVAGVIAAGAAAFALNTAVLSSESAVVSPAVVATTTATGTDSGMVSASDNDVTTNSTQVSDSVTTYQVGAAGSVVIDHSAGSVNVTDVVPAAGWTAEPARTEPDGSVKVHFIKGSTRIEFMASMSSGKVAVTVKNESIAPAPGASTPAAPMSPPPFDLDDDDDEHEGRHHDDDDEDHEDDDEDDD